MLSKLPFENRIFCLAISLIVTAFFAAINNYYFYKSQEHSASLRQTEIARMLTNYYQQCESERRSYDCVASLTTLVDSSNIYGIVSIERKDEVVYKNNTHNFGLSRKNVGSEFFINNEVSVYLGQLVTPPLWKSTIRSVTFSAMEWPSVIMSSQEPLRFARFVAWPRSAPTFSAGILVFLIVFIVRAHATALLDKNLKQRGKIKNLVAEIREGECREKSLEEEKEKINVRSKYEQEKRERLNLEVDDLVRECERVKEKEMEVKYDKERQIKELEDMIEDSWKTSYQYEKINKELEDKKQSIENESAEKDKEIKFYQDQKDFSLSKNQKKLIASILLESPEVNKSDLFKSEIGKHHSKDYVRKISSSIERNPRAKELVTKIFPKKYDSNKRGCCELFIEKDGEIFYLDVYDVGDQGYAAKIMLSGVSHWQAIAEVKYIVNTVRFFQGMTFEDKTGL
jgi:hypothetical protein